MKIASSMNIDRKVYQQTLIRSTLKRYANASSLFNVMMINYNLSKYCTRYTCNKVRNIHG